MSWITESNRYKHLLLAIPVGMLFTLLAVLGTASAMEFKDCHHSNGDKPLTEWSWESWDWLDWLATMIGGSLGQVVQILLIAMLW